MRVGKNLYSDIFCFRNVENDSKIDMRVNVIERDWVKLSFQES